MGLRHLLLFGLTFSTLFSARALPIPIELFRETEPRQVRRQIRYENGAIVKKWIRFFSVDDRERFDRFMQRGALYKDLIQDILIEQGVPAEMYYLAMVESGFARKAKSHAQAVGIWQFGAPTARLYGLRVDKYVDERLDVIRASRAAARHLRDLRAEFGSWNLAMAAYNCGVGCVRRAVRRGGSRDFWTLARARLLPSETVNYIPKFQAALQIGRNPKKYGFDRKTPYKFPVVRKVRVPRSTSLREIARRHKVSSEALIALNLHLLKARTPNGSYEIWLPSKGKKRS